MIALPRRISHLCPADWSTSATLETPDSDQALMDVITGFPHAHPAYAYRRVMAALLRDGHCVKRKRVQRLMRLTLASLPPRGESWRVANHEPTTGALYHNRQEDVIATERSLFWVGDLMYL
jgi:hypothetical protein